jgi:hypothetical protein
MPRHSATTTSSSADPAALPTSGDAVWLEPDVKGLMEYLVDHLASAGDNGNFKAVTFRGAAEHVDKIRTRGGPKTSKSCEQKYREVCQPRQLLLFALSDALPD